jgi:Xaa-Pro aminopeptidase
MRKQYKNSAFFSKNRIKLRLRLKANSLVVVHCNDEMPRNGDQYFPYRQNSDLYYLTGIIQEKTIFVLCPDHPDPTYREMLFILKPEANSELWNGHKLKKEEASEISGILNIFYTEDFESICLPLQHLSEYIYVNVDVNEKGRSEFSSRDFHFAEQMRLTYPAHQFENLGSVMAGLRMIKEFEEIALIKEAINITNQTFKTLLSAIRPGMFENEIEAEISKGFISRGADQAFLPIVAAGKNACTLHYINNNDICQAGDMVLIDFGAEYASYASDCTRTIPLSASFSERQLKLYQSVLKVMGQCKDLMRPGTCIRDLNEKAGLLWQDEHIKLGLYTISDVHNQDPEKPMWKRYFPHGVTHFMGLDVHDVGPKTEALQPGMVLTVEPGIYLPNEGIGIRLENDILVTNDEPIDLMEEIPIQPEEIVSLMSK